MRPIDADTVEFYVKNLPKRIKYPTVGDPWIHELVEVQAVLDAIKDTPTIEAKPVVHAHWEPKKIMARTPFARNYYCSNCKDEPLECKHICGNCGAQMDGTDTNVGSKGVKIPVISMEDVPKIAKESD